MDGRRGRGLGGLDLRARRGTFDESASIARNREFLIRFQSFLYPPHAFGGPFWTLEFLLRIYVEYRFLALITEEEFLLG